MMVSFDVVSRFTKEPVDEAMHAISVMLEKDETIDLRMTMRLSEICRLTFVCLRSTYFRLKDEFMSSEMEQSWVPILLQWLPTSMIFPIAHTRPYINGYVLLLWVK